MRDTSQEPTPSRIQIPSPQGMGSCFVLRAILLHVTVFTAYAVITLFFWLPVLPELGRKLIGEGGDTFQFVWNSWWAFRTVSAGQNPFFCDLQFAPFGVPLVSHTLSLIPSFIIGLVERWVGMPLAYNAVVLLLCCFAGYCMFLLARRVTGDVAGSFVGGILFMICPFMSSKLLGHLNLLCAGLLPLYTVCLFAAIDSRKAAARWGLAAVFLVTLFSNIHTVIFAGNVTLWYFVYRGWRSGRWREELRLFWRVLKPITAICGLWALVLITYSLRYHLDWSSYRALCWCPEPLNYILPIFPTSVWLSQFILPGETGWEMTNLELSVYLGWLVLPLSVAGFLVLRKHPVGRFVGIAFVCALLISPGHKLQWKRQMVKAGGVTCYLPMGFYRHVPVLGCIGQAGRYMAIGYMAMGVGVAGLVAGIRRRYGRRAALAGAIASGVLICVDFAYRPPIGNLPACPIPVGAGRVMDPRFGNTTALFYQTIHGRPLVGGYIARIPKRLRNEFALMDGIGWFFQPPERRGKPPTSTELLQALHKLNIEYVCVDRGSPDAQVLKDAQLEVIQEDQGAWSCGWSRESWGGRKVEIRCVEIPISTRSLRDIHPR